ASVMVPPFAPSISVQVTAAVAANERVPWGPSVSVWGLIASEGGGGGVGGPVTGGTGPAPPAPQPTSRAGPSAHAKRRNFMMCCSRTFRLNLTTKVFMTFSLHPAPARRKLFVLGT